LTILRYNTSLAEARPDQLLQSWRRAIVCCMCIILCCICRICRAWSGVTEDQFSDRGPVLSECACHRGRQAPLVLVESAKEGRKEGRGVEEERNSPGDITNPNQYRYHTSLRGLAPNMTLLHVRERGHSYPRASSTPGQNGSGVVVNLDI